MKASQRFIAGASCPQCGEIDVLLIDNLDQSLECVDCGFTQSAEQRDEQNKQQEKPSQKERLAKKVDVTQIIRVNQVKDK